jgi:hypothetical protein
MIQHRNIAVKNIKLVMLGLQTVSAIPSEGIFIYGGQNIALAIIVSLPDRNLMALHKVEEETEHTPLEGARKYECNYGFMKYSS